MYLNTDLAMEAHELRLRTAQAASIPGVAAEEYTSFGYPVTNVHVLDAQGAQALGKPVGTYVTVSVSPLARREEDAFARGCQAVSSLLRDMLPADTASVLVAGIGNPSVTPDAVGPLTVRHILVTRHLLASDPTRFGKFRPVSAISPGVLGMTGVETGEILRGLCEKIRPDCLIAVDALASRSTDRLCTTVQLSDTGIIPGSGVGNARNAIDRSTLGIPVIAVGVPTVVDTATLVLDLLDGTAEAKDIVLPDSARQMFVTPRTIDTQVADIAKLIGYSIDLALHDGLTVSDLDLFLS